MRQSEKFISKVIGHRIIPVVSLLVMLIVFLTYQAQAQNIRPLSKGWYRLPYSGTWPFFTGILHDGGNLFYNKHNGYDLLGQPPKPWDSSSPHKIVAMADGVVVEVEDGFNECSDSRFGLLPCSQTDCGLSGCPCNNKIWIEHPNGEFSAYFHIAHNSAQVQVGDQVVEGQYIADEGDVGSTGSSDSIYNSIYNRKKHGCNGTQKPEDFASPNCGMHLHFAVSTVHHDCMDPFTELVIPRICGLSGHVINKGETSVTDIGPCNAHCISEAIVSENYLNTQKVVAAGNSVTTSGSNLITNSVIGYEAGHKVTLKPGFRTVAGSYFRASIGTCNSFY